MMKVVLGTGDVMIQRDLNTSSLLKSTTYQSECVIGIMMSTENLVSAKYMSGENNMYT